METEKKCNHSPRKANMNYFHKGVKKDLKILFCAGCYEVLRNYTWKERDEELQEKYNYQY